MSKITVRYDLIVNLDFIYCAVCLHTLSANGKRIGEVADQLDGKFNLAVT